MRHYKLFQAWQNQRKDYTKFITKTIQKVVEIEHKKGVEIDVIRFPAQDEAGSPDVIDMVWQQIANCDLFLGDLTAIDHIGEQSISNPNVMYEIGIADALLGEKRVILVCSKDTNIAQLAFDVNHKRISPLDIENNKAAEILCEWIEAGILECDIQQLQRDFVLKDIYDDLYVVYNNLMRIIFINNFEYSNGVTVPSIEIIRGNLEKAVINELMIAIDYTCIVNRLKHEIKKLYETNNRRYISDIMRIYEALNKFNWLMCSVNKSEVFVKTETLHEVLLNYSNQFHIADLSTVDELYGSIFLQEKYVYISNNQPYFNVCLKEMLTDRVKKLCNYQYIPHSDGVLIGMKMYTYTLNKAVISKFSEYIYDVLTSVYNFMDKMNFVPTNEIPEINCNTIITWKKENTFPT